MAGTFLFAMCLSHSGRMAHHIVDCPQVLFGVFMPLVMVTWWSACVYVFVYLFVCLFVCLFVRVCVCVLPRPRLIVRP